MYDKTTIPYDGEPSRSRAHVRAHGAKVGVAARAELAVVIVDHHDPRVAVDRNGLAVRDALGAVANAQHARDPIFSADDGAVRQDGAHVRDQPYRVGEELRPCNSDTFRVSEARTAQIEKASLCYRPAW